MSTLQPDFEFPYAYKKTCSPSVRTRNLKFPWKLILWRTLLSHKLVFISKFCSSQWLTIPTWKNLCFTEFSVKIHWNTRLTASDVFICLHNQLSSFNSIIVQMSEKRVHQIGSKNEWLLLSVTFTAKLELVFVLTFENAFS